MKSILIALLAGILTAGFSGAEEEKAKCPVSGKDADPAVKSKVSITVGLCCSKCQGKFEGDAKAKKEALEKYIGSKDSPANAKCVYSNKDNDPANTVKVEKEVTFCCDNCKAKFDADPKKYIKKVK